MANYIRGGVNEVLTIATLASLTLVATNFDEEVQEQATITSIVASWAIRDSPLGLNQGPIVVGLAHSDYTDAEIEEVLELTAGWEKYDLVAREKAKRLIRVIGTFPSTPAADQAAVLNEGRPIKTKLNWQLGSGQTLKVWAYNAGGAALADSAALYVDGHANIFYR